MQRCRRESQKERRPYFRNDVSLLFDDPTLSIFAKIAVRFIDGNGRLQIAGVSLPGSCLTCDIYDRIRVRETHRRSSGDYEDYEDEEDDIP